MSGGQSCSVGPVVLMGLDFREMLSLMHFLAHYQVRLLGGAFNPAALKNDELANVYKKVWEILQAWPDGFYSLLSQYIDRPMSGRGQSGLNKHFRDMHERLYRQNENQGIARIKIEFDRYIEEYWPGVLEMRQITRIQLVSESRNVVSKKDAANILGSRPERIDKLVQQGRITRVVFKGKAHYLRDQLETLAKEISSNWTMTEACKALSVSRYQLKQLLDAGVLPALQRPDYLNRDWVVDKLGCLSLISSLRSNARKAEKPSGSLSIEGIQRQGYSIVQLIVAMQTGEIGYGVEENMGGPASLKQFTYFKIKGFP